MWRFTANGNFSSRSAYWLAMDRDNNRWPWSFVWKLHIPPKLKTFIWTLVRGRLMTNGQRITRGMNGSSTCPNCEHHWEDQQHLFRFCTTSQNIWNSVLPTTSLIQSNSNFDGSSIILPVAMGRCSFLGYGTSGDGDVYGSSS